MTTDDELFEQLRAANPHVAGDSPQPKTSQRARFEEITMQPHETHAPRLNPASAPAPWWRRPMVAAPSALALIAVLAVGALIFSTVTAPSAYALVNEAAQNAATYDSGQATVTIELREIPDDEVTGSFTWQHRYEGDNFQMIQDMSGLDMGDELDIDGEEFTLNHFEMRRVDGVTYTGAPFVGDPDSFMVAPDSEDIWDDVGFGFDPATISPEAISALLAKADGVTEVTSNDNVTVFSATIQRDVLVDVGAENLPLGLSLLAEGDDTDLPESLGLTITVNDEVLQEIAVEIVGDTAVVAPPADKIISEDEMMDDFGIPEGLEDAIAVLDELEERRPDLCNEIFEGAFEEGAEIPDGEAFEAINDTFGQCLLDADEPEAAEAWKTMNDWRPSN